MIWLSHFVAVKKMILTLIGVKLVCALSCDSTIVVLMEDVKAKEQSFWLLHLKFIYMERYIECVHLLSSRFNTDKAFFFLLL